MKNRPLVMLFWVAVFWGGLLFGSIHAINLNGNGYEFTVAISEDVANLAAEQRIPFLDALKKTLTTSSQLLFDATDSYVYFKKINILLPRTWITPNLTGTPTSAHNYLNADIRIETTLTANDPESVIEAARSYNSKMCGQPGEYMIAPPQFFLDIDGSTVKKYGDIAKAILHEFAHYRYGVHGEYGIPETFIENGDKFPYTFKNSRGEWQITGSNNSIIEGSYLINSTGGECIYPNTPDMSGVNVSLSCRFIPNMKTTTGPTTSLMFMPFLPTVLKFSDETNHDRTAPNMQNYWCRNRSTKTIILKHPDFTALKPLNKTTNTAPEFNYLLPAYQTVYIVMDISNHTLTDNVTFNYIKSEIAQKFIPQLAKASPRSFVGIATMGGSYYSNFSVSNGRLGGYLTEIQSPIQIDTNEQALANKINGLTRSSGQGLLIEKAMLDVGDVLTDFTHLSGSIAFVVKLNDITQIDEMNVESEAVHLLNSRNTRLVTFEYNADSQQNVCERSTLLTGGVHFAANSNNYSSVISSALNKTIDLVRDERFRSRRVQLLRDPFTTNSLTPFKGFYTIGAINSTSDVLEMHFFVPVSRPNNYEIFVNGTDGKTYNFTSAEHVQRYSSWDRKYKIHTFTLPTTSRSTATFMVSTTGDAMSGYFEAIEILGENVPIHVGGGGQSPNRVIDVEVYTSSNNGILDMAEINEDPSFLIFASIRKGHSFARSLRSAVAIVHGPTKNDFVSLRDDGLYPDLLEKDGIYSGFYRPPTNGKYRISVRLDGYRRSNPITVFNNPSSRSMPIDQNEDEWYKEGGSTSSFQRWIPYISKLQVQSSNFYEERPLRIMDFKIDSYDSVNNIATFSWTSPQSSYGTNESVTSYRLVYSMYPSEIINEGGVIPQTAVSVNKSDIVEGSLDPLSPYLRQYVTIKLTRGGPSSPAMYFTINSKSKLGRESYAAPMIYLTGPDPLATTTTVTTSTITPTSGIVTASTSTSTSKTTSTTRSSTATTSSTITSSTVTSPTTTVSSTEPVTSEVSASTIPSTTVTSPTTTITSSTLTSPRTTVTSTEPITSDVSTSTIPTTTVTSSATTIPSTTVTSSASTIISSTVTSPTTTVSSTEPVTSEVSTSTIPSSTVTSPASTITSSTVTYPRTTTNTTPQTTTRAITTNTIPSSTVTFPGATVSSTEPITSDVSTSTIPSTTVTSPTTTIPSTTVTFPATTIPSTTVTSPATTITSTTVTSPATTIPSTTVTFPDTTITSSTVTSPTTTVSSTESVTSEVSTSTITSSPVSSPNTTITTTTTPEITTELNRAKITRVTPALLYSSFLFALISIHVIL